MRTFSSPAPAPPACRHDSFRAISCDQMASCTSRPVTPGPRRLCRTSAGSDSIRPMASAPRMRMPVLRSDSTISARRRYGARAMAAAWKRLPWLSGSNRRADGSTSGSRNRAWVSQCGSQRLYLAIGPQLAQLELLNLARSSQRKSVDAKPVHRCLVVRERGAHVLRQFFLVDCSARRGPDDGCDLFAPFLVRQPDHRDLAHTWVSKQSLFELARIDILPAADDHVLEAALDRAIAARIHGAKVAGVQPAVGIDRSLCRLLHFEEANHDVIAA